MSDEIRAGLEAYAAGDLRTALSTWSQIDVEHPDFPHARDYLRFVQEAEPSEFQAILGDFVIPGPPGQASRPVVAPLPAAPTTDELTEVPPPPPLEPAAEVNLAAELDPATELEPAAELAPSAAEVDSAPAEFGLEPITMELPADIIQGAVTAPPEESDASMAAPNVPRTEVPEAHEQREETTVISPPPEQEPPMALAEEPEASGVGESAGQEEGIDLADTMEIEISPGFAAAAEAAAASAASPPIPVPGTEPAPLELELDLEAAELPTPNPIEPVPSSPAAPSPATSSPPPPSPAIAPPPPAFAPPPAATSAPPPPASTPPPRAAAPVVAPPPVSAPPPPATRAAPPVAEALAPPPAGDSVALPSRDSPPPPAGFPPPPASAAAPPPALDPAEPGLAPSAPSGPEFSGPSLGAPPRAVIPPAEFSAPPPPAAHDEDAFDLVEQVDFASAAQRAEEGVSTDPSSLPELERRLDELSELDDLSGALDVAKKILSHDPEHQAARAAQARSRDVLMKMSVSKIGDLTAVPTVLCPPDQVIWLDLDHRSGFILSQVDGVSTYHDIMEIAGMDPLECATILAELVAEGVIGEAR
ncbi:MAG: hypothetical protein AAF654_10655 [Myxococcota bacterium]